MKILPFTNSIKADVVSSGARIKRASVYGYKVATRTAQIYKQNDAMRMLNVARCVSSKVINGATLKELPYFGGAIGLILPIPFASVILMGIGFLARFISGGADNLYKHQNKAHTNIPID
jgi:hypothetical protein